MTILMVDLLLRMQAYRKFMLRRLFHKEVSLQIEIRLLVLHLPSLKDVFERRMLFLARTNFFVSFFQRLVM